MMLPELSLVAALLLGLMGSIHCLGMCGGMSVALSINGAPQVSWLLSYNIGRLLTYAAIGAIAGLVGAQLLAIAPQLGLVLRTLAGLLLIAMGLYVSQWWMGLTRLEQLGARLWQHIQPRTRSLLPVTSRYQALRLGILWGLLPCGLVYSTVSWTLAAAQWQQSALLMLMFGVGTLPAMLATGLVGRTLLETLRKRQARAIAGLLIILLGIATIVIPSLHGGSSEHGHHSHISKRP